MTKYREVPADILETEPDFDRFIDLVEITLATKHQVRTLKFLLIVTTRLLNGLRFHRIFIVESISFEVMDTK